MNRRTYLAAVSAVGATSLAGCGTVTGRETISDPSVTIDTPGRKALVFTSNGTEVGHFGVDGGVTDDRIEVSTEIWHLDGTRLDAISLRVWMPETATDSPATVALVSPVEGDSSPPPNVSLSTPSRKPGTLIEVTDLDDLADETISTLDLVVVPGSERATALTIDVTIDLSDGGVFSSRYTLDGELQLAYPALHDR